MPLPGPLASDEERAAWARRAGEMRGWKVEAAVMPVLHTFDKRPCLACGDAGTRFGCGFTAPPLPLAPPEHIAQFFADEHFRDQSGQLQTVSQRFAELAEYVLTLPRNPERTVALRKLLEAKDAALRAAVAK